jgi:hypothetical protein
MGQHQRATARHEIESAIPIEVAAAATRYQAVREVEAAHLALMARHNLLGNWTPEVRGSVLAAREKVRDAREARAGFRNEVRELVLTMRVRNEPLPSVLRLTRAMIHLLEDAGAVRADGHWLEAEVLAWVIEDYEIVS